MREGVTSYQGPGTAAAAGPRGRAVAAALLAAGVVCGVAGLFPGYLAGASLASQPAELVPHVIYFAVWGACAVLIAAGGGQRAGALLGTGTAVVTLGFFFADVGTAIAGGAHLIGAGLVLGLAGWLACAAGSAAALRLGPAGAPGKPPGHAMGLVMMLALAAVGTAIAFAPSWDSFTLRTAAAGAVQSVTAGDAFANPAPVIAGDVAVMVTLVAVVVVAALWHPVWQGAALLAGAIVPMAAQVVSALVQLGEGASPALFGIPAAQAAQAGVTVSSGVTSAFWLYCGFVIALIALLARMLISSSSGELSGVRDRTEADLHPL